MAIEIVDLPIKKWKFHSYVSLPGGIYWASPLSESSMFFLFVANFAIFCTCCPRGTQRVQKFSCANPCLVGEWGEWTISIWVEAYVMSVFFQGNLFGMIHDSVIVVAEWIPVNMPPFFLVKSSFLFVKYLFLLVTVYHSVTLLVNIRLAKTPKNPGG